MQKTLLITIDFPPMFGGVANYWSNLAQYFDNEKFIVLANETADSLGFDVAQRYLVYRKSMSTKSKWIWPKWLPILYHAINIVREERVQKIIVTHVLPVGTVAYLIKFFFGINYFVSLHGLDVALVGAHRWKRWLANVILTNAEKIIVNSEYTGNLIPERISNKHKEKIVIVYPCPNIAFRSVSEIERGLFKKNHGLLNKKVILTVARLIRRKGQDMVIKALPQILQLVPDSVYLIVGQGKEKNSYQELAKQLGVSGSVFFFDDIKDDELPTFYTTADVFVMPARILADGDVEGFGIVYLEAGAYGLPVVAGRVGGAPEAVANGISGLLVDPESADDIAEKIVSLLRDEQLAKRLGQNGRARVAEQFLWQNEAQKVINMLH